MASYSPVLCLPLLLILLSPLFLLRKKWESKKQKQPPGPPKLPIIGNLHQLGELPHQSLWQMSKNHGSVMLLHLGSMPTLVVSSAETAREILKTHDVDCCSRPALVGPVRLSYNYLDIAFAPYSDYWREIRKICVLQLFSAKRLQSFRFIREEAVYSVMNSIAESSSSGRPVDLSAELMSVTANIIFRTAFGRRFRGNEFGSGRIEEVVQELAGVVGSFYAADFFPYFGWIVDRVCGIHGRLERSFHRLDNFYEQLIDQHLDPERVKEEHEEDVVDVLLKIQREQSDQPGAVKLTKDHIKAILLDIFSGGINTSATVVVWAMAELARNPRIMKKAQAEVRTAIAKGNKGKVTESDLDQLLYLKLVVKETLRLHPPGPLLVPRESMSQFQINGYHINPKTKIYVNVWGIGRDPNLWKNPEEFFPERFLENSIDFRGQHFELLPFGAGRRVCPAINMGTAIVELAIANLLYHFNWELPRGMMTEEDISMEEATGIAIHKKIPLILQPTQYSQSPFENP